MKDRKLKCWMAALAALVLAFAAGCSDGSGSSDSSDGSGSSDSSDGSGGVDSSDGSGGVDVSGTYSGSDIAATYTDSSSTTVTSTLLSAISDKMDSITTNTFSMKSIGIELGSGGSYKITAVATWTASNNGVDATYAIEGSYTVSGSVISFGEPASIAVSDTARGDLSNTTDKTDYNNAVAAIKAILNALTLTYSDGTLSADLDAVYTAIAGLVSTSNSQ